MMRMRGRFGKRAAIAALVAAAAAGGAACQQNPLAPSPLALTPLDAPVVPGLQQCFIASGGTGTYQFTLFGGGTLTSPAGNFGCVLVGEEAGTYRIRVRSGSTIVETTFTVYVANSIELVSADKSPGSTLTRGERITFKLRYVNIQFPAQARVRLLDASGNPTAAEGGLIASLDVVGEVTVSRTLLDPLVGETHFIRLEMYNPSDLSQVYNDPAPVLPFFIRWVG